MRETYFVSLPWKLESTEVNGREGKGILRLLRLCGQRDIDIYE